LLTVYVQSTSMILNLLPKRPVKYLLHDLCLRKWYSTVIVCLVRNLGLTTKSTTGKNGNVLYSAPHSARNGLDMQRRICFFKLKVNDSSKN
jgi:hypothetical protein